MRLDTMNIDPMDINYIHWANGYNWKNLNLQKSLAGAKKSISHQYTNQRVRPTIERFCNLLRIPPKIDVDLHYHVV